MVIEVAIRSEYPKPEVEEAISQALKSQSLVARLRRDQFQKLCTGFESKHGLSSDEFMQRFEAGELGDDADYFDWFAAKRGLDLWDRRCRILIEAAV